MATSKTTNTYNRQNWEDAVSIKEENIFSVFLFKKGKDDLFFMFSLLYFYLFL